METSKSLKVLNVLAQMCVKISACVFFSLTGANMFCMIPCSSASEPKKGMLPFISVQHMLYAVLYRTSYRYCKRAVIL